MIMTMEDFVTFEFAKKLKEKGYPQIEQNTLAMYDAEGEWYSLAPTIDTEYCFYDFEVKCDDCVAPTISQVLKWLRKEKKIYICIDVSHPYLGDNVFAYKYRFYMTNLLNQDRESDFKVYASYEEAALAGIKYVLNF